MSDYLPGLDEWITSPRYARDTATVYCHNPACPEFNDPQVVDIEREYGRWAYGAGDEECPRCHGEWHEEPREEDDDA